ncbi:unnamed protein product [Camellia sinensis]
MAEGTYVKLTPDQASLQSITPGELYQPIDVAQINVKNVDKHFLQPINPRLTKIGQLEFLGALKIPTVGLTGLFCPCVLFGRNVENLNADISQRAACVGHIICVEGGMTFAALTSVLNGIDPQTLFLIYEGLFFAWWMCGIYTSMARQSLQKKYHLKDSPCDPCMVHCCLHWCAVCQEHREMKGHLTDNTAAIETIVNPPPVQEMNAANQTKESPSSSENGTGHTNLELQPI